MPPSLAVAAAFVAVASMGEECIGPTSGAGLSMLEDTLMYTVQSPERR
jgi:hypothetical protein